jgi:hypothetical protein
LYICVNVGLRVCLCVRLCAGVRRCAGKVVHALSFLYIGGIRLLSLSFSQLRKVKYMLAAFSVAENRERYGERDHTAAVAVELAQKSHGREGGDQSACNVRHQHACICGASLVKVSLFPLFSILPLFLLIVLQRCVRVCVKSVLWW